MDLCRYTEEMWYNYIMGRLEDIESRLLPDLEKDVVVIGTGRHEFYSAVQEFIQALSMEAGERNSLCFEIDSLWCKEKKLGEEASFVYGGIYIKGRDKQKQAVVDMDSRFTIIYRKREGVWKIAHIHQSLPFQKQEEGEYYPKILIKKFHEEIKRANEMEELARIDDLTGVTNRRFFFNQGRELLEEGGQVYCMAIDLDDFKKINDGYGHEAGDEVLETFGKILRESIGEKGIVGRIGGDEFGVFCGRLSSREAVRKLGEEIINRTRREREKKKDFPGVSIGIVKARETESVKEVFRRADACLYEMKRKGKDGFQIEAD